MIKPVPIAPPMAVYCQHVLVSQVRTARTNHSNVSRLERTLQLNMVGVIQATPNTLLNLAILTELPCDGVVRVFLGLDRLLHCVFDAQRFALTRKKPW